MRRKKSPNKSPNRTPRTVRILVTCGRENPTSRTNHPTDEEYREWEFTLDVRFHQSADRILRDVAYDLRNRGFKVRQYNPRSCVEGPG